MLNKSWIWNFKYKLDTLHNWSKRVFVIFKKNGFTNLRHIITTILIIRLWRRRRHSNCLLAAKKCRSIWVRPTIDDRNIHGAFCTTFLKVKDFDRSTFFRWVISFSLLFVEQFVIFQVSCNCDNFVVDRFDYFSVWFFDIVFKVWKKKKRITQISLLLRFHKD